MQFPAQSRLIKRSFNVVKIRIPWDYQLKLSQGCELKQRHVSCPGILILISIWMDQEAERRKTEAVLERERAKACHKNGLIRADTAAWSPPSSLAPGSAAAQKSFAHPSTTFTEMRLFTWPTTAALWMHIGCVGVVIQPQTYNRRNRTLGYSKSVGQVKLWRDSQYISFTLNQMNWENFSALNPDNA